MKQTLSVADFAIIFELVNRETEGIEHYLKHCKDTVGLLGTKKRANQRYQDLKHLKQSLQNLNVEVETPKVEVETNEP